MNQFFRLLTLFNAVTLGHVLTKWHYAGLSTTTDTLMLIGTAVAVASSTIMCFAPDEFRR